MFRRSALVCSKVYSSLAPAHRRLDRSARRSRSHTCKARMSADGAKPTSRVAVGQMTSTNDVDANFLTCESLAKQAAQQNCSMLFLPECFSFLGKNQQESIDIAQSLDGPVIARYKKLAQEIGLWLSLGGFQETGPDPGHIFNCHLIINSAGEIVTEYRKIHLFNVDVPGGAMLMESNFTAPGSDVAVCNSPVGMLGLSICYDLRFPEIYQALRFQKGAQILLVPAAFTKPTGQAHWEVLLRARAIECQCYVIAAAQAGKHHERRESFGHSLIIDPWGKVVGRLDDGLETGIAIADIDLDYIDQLKVKMPLEEHRVAGRKCVGGSFVDLK